MADGDIIIPEGWKTTLGDLAEKVPFDSVNDLADAYVKGLDWRSGLGDLGSHEKLKDISELKAVVEAYVNAPEKREVPEKYTIPENFKVEGFENFVKEAGFTQKDVDAIVKFNSDHVKTLSEKALTEQNNRLNELKTEWGDSYDDNVKLAKLAVKQFDDDDGSFAKMLKSSRAGNEPVVIKFFSSLGGMLKEDGYLKSEDNTGGTKKSIAERLYPNQGK